MVPVENNFTSADSALGRVWWGRGREGGTGLAGIAGNHPLQGLNFFFYKFGYFVYKVAILSITNTFWSIK
jgi:hypothetical protein